MFIASSSLSVCVGIGMWQIITRFKAKIIRYSLISVFCVYLFFITVNFFLLEPHMANRPVEEYMTTHLSYFLQNKYPNQNEYVNYCMRVNPEQFKFLNWIHAQNQYRYFAPTVSIEQVYPDTTVKIDTLYLDKNCQPKTTYQKYIIHCSQNLYSICPQPTQFRRLYEPNEINKDFIFYY